MKAVGKDHLLKKYGDKNRAARPLKGWVVAVYVFFLGKT